MQHSCIIGALVHSSTARCPSFPAVRHSMLSAAMSKNVIPTDRVIRTVHWTLFILMTGTSVNLGRGFVQQVSHSVTARSELYKRSSRKTTWSYGIQDLKNNSRPQRIRYLPSICPSIRKTEKKRNKTFSEISHRKIVSSIKKPDIEISVARKMPAKELFNEDMFEDKSEPDGSTYGVKDFIGRLIGTRKPSRCSELYNKKSLYGMSHLIYFATRQCYL